MKRLTRDRVLFLRDRVDKYSFDGRKLPVDAYLGIDIGSVSTNLTLIDDDGLVIKEIYLRTQARPIEIVHQGLQEIEREVGDKVRIRGVGTTGSGRELIGELIGADTIVDEITAHKTGAAFIGDAMIGKKVDTIFEIGGQDAKFISIADGIVVDFTMNEACAAGTGSFLEEQAEKLDVNIVNRVRRPRLLERAAAPPRRALHRLHGAGRLGVPEEGRREERHHRGARVLGRAELPQPRRSGPQDRFGHILPGRHRVQRRRRGGVQRGARPGDHRAAVQRRHRRDRRLAPRPREGAGARGRSRRFRGYDLTAIDYKLREFTCQGCTNYCDIQEFNVEGNKTYWGDKCSDRYRKRAKVPRKPTIPNLMTLYNELLERDYIPLVEKKLGRAIDTSAPGAERRREAAHRRRALDVFLRPASLLGHVPPRPRHRGRAQPQDEQEDRAPGDRGGRRRAVLPDPGRARPHPRAPRAGGRRHPHAERHRRRDGRARGEIVHVPVGADASRSFSSRRRSSTGKRRS